MSEIQSKVYNIDDYLDNKETSINTSLSPLTSVETKVYNINDYLDDEEESLELSTSATQEFSPDKVYNIDDYADTFDTSKRTGPIQEAEPEGILNNLMKGVYFIDRPRASMAGGLTEVFSQIGSGEFDLNAIKAEMAEGIKGEDHQMMFDVFKNKILDVKENPENYPMASKLLPAIDTILSIPNFIVEEGMTRYSDPRKNFALGLAALLYPTKDDGTPTPFAEKFQNFKEYQSNERSIVDRFTNPDTMGTDKMAFIAGLALDIAIDPVTYTNPILKVINTGRALTTKYIIPDAVLNQVSKTSGKAKDEIVKALTTTDLGLSLSKGADFIWGVFSTKHGLTGQQVEWQSRFKNLIAAARVKAIRENEELRDRIAQYSKDTGVPVEEVNMFIIEAVERGGIPNVKLENLPKETVALLANDSKLRNEIRNLALKNEDQLALEISMGVPLTKLGDQVLVNQADEGGELIMFYFNHAITPEARKAAIKRKIKEGTAPSFLNSLKGKGDKWEKVKYWFTNKHSSSLKRRKQWEGLTINDINELAKKGELPGYKGQVFENGFFYADASVAQALRDFKHHKSIAAATLAGEITKKGGLGISPDDLIREAKALGYKQKKSTAQGAIKFLREEDPDKWGNYVLAENKFTQNYAIPKDTAEFVDTTLKYINDPKQINLFLEKYDWATRWFKSWTLSIFPSYHIRNKVGNLWNNFVIGVEPKAYKDALKYQQGISAGEDGFILIGKNKMSYKELRNLVEQEAVTGRGLFTADIESSLIAEMGEAKWLTLSPDNKAILIGKRVGEAVENNARLANFIDGLRKGLSPTDAAKRVKKALFDYSDLTKTEQDVFKRLFPFYTWTRKNLPYQLEMLVKHPGKYKAVDTTRMELEARIGEEDPNERFIGGWMLANYPTKIKLDKEGNPKYFMLGGWWSGADLWKLGSQPTKLATDLLHPILKVMYESTNADENGYITDLFSGKKLHPDLNMEYLFGWDGNRLDVSETTAHYLNNIRVLSTIDSMIDTYYNVNYPEQKRISAFSRTPTTVEEAWLHFITGVKTFSIDLENNRLFSYKDIENEIAEINKRKKEAVKRKRPIEELAEYDQQIKELLQKFKESKGFAEGGLVSQMNRLRFNEGGKVKEQPNWFRRKFNKVDSYLNNKIDDFSKTMKADEGFTKYMQHWLIDAPVEASKKLPFIDDKTYEYKEPPENATVLENAQTLASNILPSGKDLGKAIVGVATSPIETTDAILGVTAGALANALPQNWVDTVDSFGTSFGLSSSKDNQEMASAFGQAIINDYGTLEDFKNTAIRNPAQVMLDMWAAGTLAKMGYKTAMKKIPKSVKDITPEMKEKFLAAIQDMDLPVEKVLDKGVLGVSLAPKKSEIFPTPDGRKLTGKQKEIESLRKEANNFKTKEDFIASKTDSDYPVSQLGAIWEGVQSISEAKKSEFNGEIVRTIKTKDGKKFDVDASIAPMVLNINNSGYTTAQSMSGLKADYVDAMERYSHNGYLSFWHSDLNKKQKSDIIEAANFSGLSIKEDSEIFFQPAITIRVGLYKKINPKTGEPSLNSREYSSKFLLNQSGNKALEKWVGRGDGTDKKSDALWDEINDATEGTVPNSYEELAATLRVIADKENVSEQEMFTMFIRERGIAEKEIKKEYVPITDEEITKKWADFEQYLLKDLPVIDKFMSDIKITHYDDDFLSISPDSRPSAVNEIVLESISKPEDFLKYSDISSRPAIQPHRTTMYDDEGRAGRLSMVQNKEFNSKGDVVDSPDTYHVSDVLINNPYWNKRIGKRLYLKAIQTLLKKGSVNYLQSDGSVSNMAARTWKSLEDTSPNELIRLGFPDLVGTFSVSRPAYIEAESHARAGSYDVYDKYSNSIIKNDYSADQYYLESYKNMKTGKHKNNVSDTDADGGYVLENIQQQSEHALFEAELSPGTYRANVEKLKAKKENGEYKKQYAKGGVVSEHDFKLTSGQWTRLTSWFRTQYTPKLKNKQAYLRSLSPEDLENMWTAMLLLDRDIPVNTVAITNDGTPLWFEPKLAKEAVPRSMPVPKPDTTDISHMSDEDVHKAAEIAEQWKKALKVALKNEPVMGSEKWLQNAAEDIKAGLRSDSFAKKQAKRKEEALLKKSNKQDLLKTGASTTNSVSQTKEEKPGWKMAKDGNYWSIDTAHKHWQTQKGVDEAKEIFGDKPGWVNNEAFYKKYRRQYADGGLVSPFDGLEQSIIDEIESLDVFNWIKKKAKKKLAKGFDTLGDNPTREQVETLWTENQKSLGLLAPEIQDRITNTYEDAYDSYFNLDIPTGDDTKVAGAVATGGGFLRPLLSAGTQGASRATPLLSAFVPGTAQAPTTTEMYGVEFGTPEYYSAGVSFGDSLLSNKKDKREDRINRTNKMEELRAKNAQAVAQAKARDEEQREIKPSSGPSTRGTRGDRTSPPPPRMSSGPTRRGSRRGRKRTSRRLTPGR